MRALACGVLAALFVSLLAPAVAGAHATIVRTTPGGPRGAAHAAA